MSEFTYRKKLVIFMGVPVKKITLYIHIEHCAHYVFFVLREFGALLWTILANHEKQASFEAYKIVKEKHI